MTINYKSILKSIKKPSGALFLTLIITLGIAAVFLRIQPLSAWTRSSSERLLWVFYHMGDSAVNENGEFELLTQPLTGGSWVCKPADAPIVGEKESFIWYAINIPETGPNGYSISFRSVGASIQAFQGTNLIYKYGNQMPPGKNTGIFIHKFHIPQSQNSSVLYIRTSFHHLSRFAELSSIRLGDFNEIEAPYLRRGMFDYILFVLYLVTGIAMIVVHFALKRRVTEILVFACMTLFMAGRVLYHALILLPFTPVGSGFTLALYNISVMLLCLTYMYHLYITVDASFAGVNLIPLVVSFVVVVVSCIADITGLAPFTQIPWLIPLNVGVCLVPTITTIVAKYRKGSRDFSYYAIAFVVLAVMVTLDAVMPFSPVDFWLYNAAPLGFMAFLSIIFRKISAGVEVLAENTDSNAETEEVASPEGDEAQNQPSLLLFLIEGLTEIFKQQDLEGVKKAVFSQMKYYYTTFHGVKEASFSAFAASPTEQGHPTIEFAEGRFKRIQGTPLAAHRDFSQAVSAFELEGIDSFSSLGRKKHDIYIAPNNKLYMYIHIDGVKQAGGQQELFDLYASSVSAAINYINEAKSAESAQRETVRALGEICERYISEPANHVKRVAEYSRILAQLSGLTDHEAARVGLAAVLHDIGMLTVSDKIINKTEQLTEQEYEIIRTHTEVGHEFLLHAQGELTQAAAVIAQQHHEKFDGSGYLGLSAEEIHIYGRIVALADAFDAMVTGKPNKPPMEMEQVIEHLKEQSGKHFDPNLTKLFIDNFQQFAAVLEALPAST